MIEETNGNGNGYHEEPDTTVTVRRKVGRPRTNSLPPLKERPPELSELDEQARLAATVIAGLVSNSELRADKDKMVRNAWGYVDLIEEEKRRRLVEGITHG